MWEYYQGYYEGDERVKRCYEHIYIYIQGYHLEIYYSRFIKAIRVIIYKVYPKEMR